MYIYYRGCCTINVLLTNGNIKFSPIYSYIAISVPYFENCKWQSCEAGQYLDG